MITSRRDLPCRRMQPREHHGRHDKDSGTWNDGKCPADDDLDGRMYRVTRWTRQDGTDGDGLSGPRNNGWIMYCCKSRANNVENAGQDMIPCYLALTWRTREHMCRASTFDCYTCDEANHLFTCSALVIHHSPQELHPNCLVTSTPKSSRSQMTIHVIDLHLALSIAQKTPSFTRISSTSLLKNQSSSTVVVAWTQNQYTHASTGLIGVLL